MQWRARYSRLILHSGHRDQPFVSRSPTTPTPTLTAAAAFVLAGGRWVHVLAPAHVWGNPIPLAGDGTAD